MRIQQCDMDNVRAPLDFIGINLYYRTIISAAHAWRAALELALLFSSRKNDRRHQGPANDLEWEVWPEALY